MFLRIKYKPAISDMDRANQDQQGPVVNGTGGNDNGELSRLPGRLAALSALSDHQSNLSRPASRLEEPFPWIHGKFEFGPEPHLVVHQQWSILPESLFPWPSEMPEKLNTISPATNRTVVTRDATPESEIGLLPGKAVAAFEAYRKSSLMDRQQIVAKALDLLQARQERLAKELTEQMGRPIKFTAKEITTAVARGRYLLGISQEALQDTPGVAEEGFKRYIRKSPVGPVLIIFAWNVSLGKKSLQLLSHTCYKKRFLMDYAVSLLDPCKFFDSIPSRWEYSHPQAFSPNTYDC